MNIQKGLVKDLGYDDTECTYVIGADGTQYYFVDSIKLPNDLKVVTPNVREAVNHEVYASLGVMNKDGVLIVPCENKRVETLVDRFILVEPTKVLGHDVQASIAVKNDPVQASVYNNNSMTIKQALQTEMGPEGSFVFDDMFSEANILDFNGTRVLGTDSTGVSFIGRVGKDLYLHTINPNDSIKAIKAPVELGPTIPQVDEQPQTNVMPEVEPDENKESSEVEEAPEISSSVEEKEETPTISNEIPENKSNVNDVLEKISSNDNNVENEIDEDETLEETDKYQKYTRTTHEDPNRKNVVYDEAAEAIKHLLEKTTQLEKDVESKGVRVKELELDNEDFVRTIKEQKTKIEKLENEKEEHLIKIRNQNEDINSLEEQKKDHLATIEAQKKKIIEQDEKLKKQDEELTEHESGKEELVRLLENTSKVLDERHSFID